MKRHLLLLLCLLPALLAGCSTSETLSPSTVVESQSVLSADAAVIQDPGSQTTAIDDTGYTDLLCSGSWSNGHDQLSCQAGGSYSLTGSAEETGYWQLEDDGDVLSLTLKPTGGENRSYQLAFYEDGSMTTLSEDGTYTQWTH